MVFISLEKIIIFGLWIIYLGLVQRNSIVFPQSLYVLYHINTFVWNHGWGFVSYKISLSSHYLSKYRTHISRHLNLLSLKYILVFISINVLVIRRKICYQVYWQYTYKLLADEQIRVFIMAKWKNCRLTWIYIHIHVPV